MRASCHQYRVKSAVCLIEAEVSDYPHSVGTAQALCATCHQDALVMVLLRQKAIGCGEDIERPGYVKRLHAIENDNCDFSLCHRYPCPCARNDPFSGRQSAQNAAGSLSPTLGSFPGINAIAARPESRDDDWVGCKVLLGHQPNHPFNPRPWPLAHAAGSATYGEQS